VEVDSPRLGLCRAGDHGGLRRIFFLCKPLWLLQQNLCSIGAVIVCLTWLYLTGLVILVGGEMNAEIEHAAPEGKAPGE
jgi:hypothetical protein